MANEETVNPEKVNPEEVSAEQQVPQDESLQAEASEASGGLPEPTVESLLAEVAALQEELSAVKDQSLRTAAEAQNIRRRSEQDVDKARKFALEKFSGELLPVVDNLERALETVDPEQEQVKAFAEGVENSGISGMRISKTSTGSGMFFRLISPMRNTSTSIRFRICV